MLRRQPSHDAGVGLPAQNVYRVIQIQYSVAAVSNLCWKTVSVVWFTDFGTNRKLICDFLLVINSNLLRILHRFRDIAFDRSKIAIFCYPYRV